MKTYRVLSPGLWLAILLTACLSDYADAQKFEPDPYEDFEFQRVPGADDLNIPKDLHVRYGEREYVKETLHFRKPRRYSEINYRAIDGLPEADFLKIAGELAVAEILYSTAVANGFLDEQPELRRELERAGPRVASFIHYRKTVLDHVDEPSDADIERVYHEQKAMGFPRLYPDGERVPANPPTLDALRPRIVSRLKFDRRRALELRDSLKSLETYRERFTIRYSLIEADTPAPYAIVLEGEDLRVPYGELARVDEDYHDKLKTPRDLDRALVTLHDVAMKLREIAAEETGIRQSSAFTRGMNEVAIDKVAAAYLSALGRELLVISEQNLKDFYAHYREMFKIPARLKLYKISKRVPPNSPVEGAEIDALKQQLKEWTNGIATASAFSAVVRQHSDDEPTRSRGGLVGMVPITFRDGYGGILNQLDPGEVSPPVLFDNEVTVFFAAAKEEATHQPFDQVREALRSQYLASGTTALYHALLTRLPGSVGLDFPTRLSDR